MAISALYSYRYRLRWAVSPVVVLADQYGVGLDPVVTLEGTTVTLTPRQPMGFPRLDFDLGHLPLQEGDVVEVYRSIGHGHSSVTWWHQWVMQAHLGQLTHLSGEYLGDQGMLEIVNDCDVDGKLALYQRGKTLRLSPGESEVIGDYHLHLAELNGFSLGAALRAIGYFVHRDHLGLAEAWLKRTACQAKNC